MSTPTQHTEHTAQHTEHTALPAEPPNGAMTNASPPSGLLIAGGQPGSQWFATGVIRYAIRYSPNVNGEVTEKVLQQLYVSKGLSGFREQWRDVPTVDMRGMEEDNHNQSQNQPNNAAAGKEAT